MEAMSLMFASGNSTSSRRLNDARFKTSSSARLPRLRATVILVPIQIFEV